MEYVRARVDGVTVGFGRQHRITVVKFRLHDLSTVVFHWHSPIAAHVHDHLLPGVDRLSDRAIDLQPHLAAEDWDGKKVLTPTGMAVDEYEDGIVLTPNLPRPSAVEQYFLDWEQAAVLKHYLAAVRSELPEPPAPHIAAMQARTKKGAPPA